MSVRMTTRACVCTSVYRLGGMRGEGLRAGRLCPSLTAFSLVMTVKKKCSAGLKLSNLMNLGRKKSTSLEPPERSLETSSKSHGDHQGPGLLHCGGACLRRPLGLAREHTKLGFGFVFPVGYSLCFTRFCPAIVLGL